MHTLILQFPNLDGLKQFIESLNHDADRTLNARKVDALDHVSLARAYLLRAEDGVPEPLRVIQRPPPKPKTKTKHETLQPS